MRSLRVVVFSVLCAGPAWAQTSPVADKKPATPDALKESAREKKPVFLWVLGGAPADGRC